MRQRDLAQFGCGLALVMLLDLVGCGGGGANTPTPASASRPPVDPCALLSDATVSAAAGRPFVNAHVPLRFQTMSRLASYGFQCEWTSTAGPYFVDLNIWPPPGGNKLYYAATHIPPGYEVSPRPATSELSGVPGEAVILPGEVEFLTPQGLIAVQIGSRLAQQPDDSVARALAPVAAANLAKLNRP